MFKTLFSQFILTFFLTCFLILVSGCQLSSFSNYRLVHNDELDIQKAKQFYVAKQYDQAYEIAQRLAQNDHAEAQYLLGYLIYYGQGTTENRKQGTKWIEVSAESGHRPAIEALVMINHGLTPDNNCDPNQKK